MNSPGSVMDISHATRSPPTVLREYPVDSERLRVRVPPWVQRDGIFYESFFLLSAEVTSWATHNVLYFTVSALLLCPAASVGLVMLRKLTMPNGRASPKVGGDQKGGGGCRDNSGVKAKARRWRCVLATDCPGNAVIRIYRWVTGYR